MKKKEVDILHLKRVLINSSFLLLSVSSMPALAMGNHTVEMNQVNRNEVLQNGKTIRGIVEDTAGPIAGANIVLKGSTIGVISDADGRFVLENVPNNAILVVSFMGYVPQEIKVGNQTSLKISLVEDN